jgi:hypothetical protein
MSASDIAAIVGCIAGVTALLLQIRRWWRWRD